MSFSAATCITFNGLPPSPQVGPFTIYYDSGHTEVILSNVNLSELTPPNCPYIISNIDDGTEFFYFKDQNNYCFTISVQDNDICSNCNLGLSQYSSTTITRLSCGVLTGSCQNITDYVIHWYGPNDTTTLALTSGGGNIFSGEYEHIHPFLNNNSVPLPEGVYTPVIEKIILSGLTFSNTGGTNNILVDLNTCLPSTTIQPLTCSNKTNFTNEFTGYNHFISYDFNSSNLPVPVIMTYKVSSSTKFIGWKFKGETNPDRIQIKFSGASYGTNIIGLDDVIVGSNLTSSNFNPTVFPKSASTSYYFTKLTCLTGLTVNDNDNILITVTPASTDTKWSLYSTCISNFDCNTCLTSNDYKIIGSTITGITGSCKSTIKFSISGCNENIYKSSDLYKYYFDPYSIDGDYQYVNYTFSNINIIVDYPYMNPLQFISADYLINQNVCYEIPLYTITSSCTGDTNNVIYEKTFVGGVGSKGIYNITGSSTVISSYYNSWSNLLTNYSGSSSSTDVNYYRLFFMNIPGKLTSNNCNESPSVTRIEVHPSSKVTTGITNNGSYYFKLTAETISNNFSAVTNCDINCLSKSNGFVDRANESSTGTTLDYGNYRREFIYDPTTNKYGVYYTNGFYWCQAMNKYNTTISAQTIGGLFYTNHWTTNTIPYSGISNTLIPPFSGTLCNYNTLGGKITPYKNSYYNEYNLFNYFIIKPNTSDFEIWASPIVNFSANTNFNSAILAYRYSGGSATTINPTYIIT